MTIFTLEKTKALMPRQIQDKMIVDTRTESVIARLSSREPMKFGNTDIIHFNELPKAEFVAAGGQKSPTDAGYKSITATPRKAQVTMRFHEEVLWADEDYQLGVVSQLSKAGAEALGRALDFGVIHRINPLTGSVVNSFTDYIATSNKKVEINTADADADLRAAVGLLIAGDKPTPVTGVAMDPKFGWALSDLKNKDGVQRYPQLGFGQDITSIMGLPAAVGSTVSGVPEATDTKLRAIVGDFNDGVRWGVQRDMWMEVITAGDPDGQGDLKRQNEVAIRLEVVYGWAVLADRFALVVNES